MQSTLWVSRPPPATAGGGQGEGRWIEVSEADASAIRAVAADLGRDADLVEQRLARGCRCFVARVEGEVAGYGWLSTGPEWIGEPRLEIRPGPGEGYIWNCVTLAPHRRKGVFTSLLRGITAKARESGLGRVWVGSVAIPAERAVGPAGFQPALHFETTHFAGVGWLRVSPSGDPELAREALKVMGVQLGSSLRLAPARRH